MSFMKQDVVHSTLFGAAIGVVVCVLLLSLVHTAGLANTAAGWMPFVFLAVVLLGFGWGSRYIRDGVRLTHAVGYGALTFLVIHGLAGGVVYLWSVTQWPNAMRRPLLAGGVALWLAFDYAAFCAWRCLATSRAQRAAARQVSRRPVGA